MWLGATMLDRAGLERMNITPDGGGCAFRMSSVEGWEDDRGEREGGREQIHMKGT